MGSFFNKLLYICIVKIYFYLQENYPQNIYISNFEFICPLDWGESCYNFKVYIKYLSGKKNSIHVLPAEYWHVSRKPKTEETPGSCFTREYQHCQLARMISTKLCDKQLTRGMAAFETFF